jgi:hypothetical protein
MQWVPDLKRDFEFLSPLAAADYPARLQEISYVSRHGRVQRLRTDEVKLDATGGRCAFRVRGYMVRLTGVAMDQVDGGGTLVRGQVVFYFPAFYIGIAVFAVYNFIMLSLTQHIFSFSALMLVMCALVVVVISGFTRSASDMLAAVTTALDAPPPPANDSV